VTVYFKWTDDYSFGVANIDQQHQYIFQLANEIQYSSPSEFDQYAEKLYKYTKYHFNEEEQYYKQIGSPLLKEHLKLHNQLLDSLISIVDEGLSTYEKFEKLKTFYLNWLVDHILYQDRRVLRDIKPKLL
jgi:hemerythrin